jgi:hypothetical protein
MADLNVMLLEHARSGLQTRLDTAVTNGDTEEARKITAEMVKLEATTAPKPAAYGDAEIKAALEAKADWFGVDPRKSGAAIRLGKDMNPKKFPTADAFADALMKAVEEEFKPSSGKGAEAETDPDADPEAETDPDADPEAKPAPKAKRTDAPNENDTAGARRRAASGPWTKISDAPADIQKEIRRTADKFAPKTKEGRENYITRALEAQYAQHQRTKGKK